MNDSQPPLYLIALFPVIIVGIWCGVVFLLASIGGWHRLAKFYATNKRPSTKGVTMQSGMIGMMSYGNCLGIHVEPGGFFLSILLPFRFAHPTLFIPWEAIRNPTVRRFLWSETVKFDVGDPRIATLRLPKKAFIDYDFGNA
jgi:hypothetical protein